MKTIYLHIGAEKTGTTSIQRYCKNNRDKLLSEGLLYPQTISGSELPGHFALAASTIKKVEPGKAVDFMAEDGVDFDIEWENIRCQVEEEREKNVLISCEHFSSRMRDQHVAILKSKLNEIFPDFKFRVLIALRRQDQLFESAYSTSIKSGSRRTVRDFFEDAMKKSHYFDFLSMLDRWERVFGFESMIVTTFDEVRQDGSLVSSFLRLLGLRLRVDESRYLENRALSPIASLCGCMINSYGSAASAQRLANIEKLVGSQRGHILTQRESAVIVQRYHADNRYIAKKYLQRPYLFEDDSYVWKREYKYISESEAKDRLIMSLLDEMK